jgi:tetratricopeptide (TPR) repeat protein
MQERFMNRRCVQLGTILGLATALGLAATAARAEDTVKTVGSKTPSRCAVTGITSTEVTIDENSISKTVPVNEVEWIAFDEEPRQLTSARSEAAAGKFDEALASLKNLNPTDYKRLELRQEIEFYKAYVPAQLALLGSGNINEAAAAMVAFAKNHATSWHYYDSCQAVGDLALAMKKLPAAQTFYGNLAKAPWPDFKMRANVALAYALVAQGETAKALPLFETVLSSDARGELADRQKLAATLGKARCLASAQKPEEAVKMVREVIANSSPEDTAINAQAYNALGGIYRKAHKTDDALLAFLHVELLYPSIPKERIEALENLAALWTEKQRPDRANEAKRILADEYGRQ